MPGPDNDLCGEAVLLSEQLLRRYGLDPDAWPHVLLAAMRDVEPASSDVRAPSVEDLQQPENTVEGIV